VDWWCGLWLRHLAEAQQGLEDEDQAAHLLDSIIALGIPSPQWHLERVFGAAQLCHNLKAHFEPCLD